MKIYIEKLKIFLIGLYNYIKNSPVLYWISRNLILIGAFYFAITALIVIPKITTYIIFITTLELIAIGLAQLGAYIYTNIKFTIENNGFVLGLIYLATHLLVAISSIVVFSDLI